MEADFSGYATKAGLKCSDGRTIMPGAFRHQDNMQVPLVWQHGHNDPENVLGHVILEHREDGVYGYGFFNESVKAKHTKGALVHKDINQMSIWANDLIERQKCVLHGVIREVSLVLSGANPGAIIDNIRIQHSSDAEEDEVLDDEAIIYTGLELEHSSKDDSMGDKTEDDEVTTQEVYDSLTDEQKEFFHSIVGEALETGKEFAHADSGSGDETIEDVYNSMSEKQKQVLHFMVGEALQSSGSSDMQQDNLNDDDNNEDKKGEEMKHNVFEDQKDDKEANVLSHEAMSGIISDATKTGSLRDAVDAYAIAHGITDIDTLFPDAVALDKTPEFLSRRVEWVNQFLSAVRKSPFSRIKTITADLTFEEARAKGYVTGALKREEFFGVSKRETTPTTIYKKQKLDRDDVVDITDFDVVAWLKSEMRLMLDEEIARAALMGDGRDVSHADKISETSIRPIAKEHELFATTVNVNLGDASSSIQELVDAVVANRKFYKGTGMPTFFTTETIIAKFLLLKDTLGRRIYKSLDEVASELRVTSIVSVEAMEEDPTLVGVIVNPVDYVMGSTAGGQVSMFEDFDIDYNQQKYLIETRCSGALTRMKSALVLRARPSTDVLVTPSAPTFDAGTGELTIVDTANVVYKNSANTTVNAAGSPYTVASGDSETITATPAAGYYFATSEDDTWTFTAE
jgi:HK97 family phage prohead protease